jgi:hypothetical protein
MGRFLKFEAQCKGLCGRDMGRTEVFVVHLMADYIATSSHGHRAIKPPLSCAAMTSLFVTWSIPSSRTGAAQVTVSAGLETKHSKISQLRSTALLCS